MIKVCTNFLFMEFLWISDVTKRLKEKYSQTEQEGCTKECLHCRISRHAPHVLRGAYLGENVST
jgi:hypothetical protein